MKKVIFMMSLALMVFAVTLCNSEDEFELFIGAENQDGNFSDLQ